MKGKMMWRALPILVAGLLLSAPALAQFQIQHVLLISIDGMHSLDFANCSKGIATINGGLPFCPNLANLALDGVNFTQAYTPRPSDSFPGLMALITGGTPRSTGVYYDVSYDRTYAYPAVATPNGIPAGPCPPATPGAQVGLDESVDVDLTRLDGGGGINPNYLPRNAKSCAPIYPWQFLRVNTIFEVVKAHGGYTAWSDKHVGAYTIVNGPSGGGVSDYYSPEINSNVVGLPSVPGCQTIPDPNGGVWTDSFQNIQCYDTLKVQAILNEIDGKTHDGAGQAPVPRLFGMNFQAVSVGQKLVEKINGATVTGGYLDALGTPTTSLLGEIQYVDSAIGQFVSELQKQGLLNSTLVIITAKHGQSPIDPNRVLRIPHDNPALEPPSAALGALAAQEDEDDVSLLWLTDQSQTTSAALLLSSNLNSTGQGEVFAGPSIVSLFSDPATDPRTPDIAVAPNVGVVYTGGGKKVSEHGGFANDDRNVMLLVANPGFAPKTVTVSVETRQVAPTILKALGIGPAALKALKTEPTETLPGLKF